MAPRTHVDAAGVTWIEGENGQWVPVGFPSLHGPAGPPNTLPPMLGYQQPQVQLPSLRDTLPALPPPTMSPPRPPQRNASPGPSRMPLGELDPASVPLPDSSDIELVARPAARVPGGRRPDRKGKGKARARSPSPAPKAKGKRGRSPSPLRKSSKRKAATASAEPEPKRRRGGRQPGAANFNDDDVEALLDITREHLPAGGRGWNEVADDYAEWARENGRPERGAKSLEAKFKQFVKTTVPTGDAECPPHVEEALEIEHLINEKVHTRDLDDDEIMDPPEADAISVSSDGDEDEDKENRPPPPAVKRPVVKTEPGAASGPVARRAPSGRLESSAPRERAARSRGPQLIDSLSHALDPSVRAARDESRASHAFQQTQVLTLSNQLRDATQRVDRMQLQLMQLERERNEALRRADRADMELRIVQLGPHGAMSARPATPFFSHRRVRRDIQWPDGGSSTTWVTASEDEHDPMDLSPQRRIYWPPTPTPPRRDSRARSNRAATMASAPAGPSSTNQGVEVVVSPSAPGTSSAVSVMVTPHRRHRLSASVDMSVDNKSDGGDDGQ